jgi:hypothetical protein
LSGTFYQLLGSFHEAAGSEGKRIVLLNDYENDGRVLGGGDWNLCLGNLNEDDDLNQLFVTIGLGHLSCP